MSAMPQSDGMWSSPSMRPSVDPTTYEIIPPPEVSDLEECIARLETENHRLKRRTMHQRRELRSLNKHLRFWAAIGKGKMVMSQREVVYMDEPRSAPSMVPGLLAVAAVVVLAVTLLLTR